MDEASCKSVDRKLIEGSYKGVDRGVREGEERVKRGDESQSVKRGANG
jgi:hypothetical protein